MARLVCTVLCAFWLCACGTKAAKPVAARDAGAGTDGGGGPRSFSNLNQPHAISDAFMLAEGPVWDTCNKRLLFLDIATRKIHALDERLAVSDLVIGTNYAAGMAIGPKGEWLVAEMGSDTGGRVSSWQHAGRGMDTFTPLVEKDPAGKPLGTVCDLVSASDGTIYFTDPVFPHGPYTAYDAAARPIYR
ncbi:MAG TPA: SMP-30/gluconolactonase/LRE family protein, partial [Polyangiales bacterium]|nr:SMP-30/gluconolactonase/LRE family protein [Polyangiales bacterium]